MQQQKIKENCMHLLVIFHYLSINTLVWLWWIFFHSTVKLIAYGFKDKMEIKSSTDESCETTKKKEKMF